MAKTGTNPGQGGGGAAEHVIVDSGTVTANQGTKNAGGAAAWPVSDDMTGFEAQHITLTASTDRPITFAQSVRLVRVSNWDTANRVLVKNSAIGSNTDPGSARVGIAPTANVPSDEYFPFTVTTTLVIRSAGASEVTVTGFF